MEDAPTILVIEDHPILRGLVVETLTDAGYAVQEAWNGDAAIVLLTGLLALGRRPDLIVLDMKLPYADGQAVLRYLAEHRVAVPVLATSGHADLLTLAVHEGATATLPKPYELDTLLVTVARYCSRPT